MVLISAATVIAAAAIAVVTFKRRPAVSLLEPVAIPMTGANDNHIAVWRASGVI
jgi:hypothetical protein